MTDIQATKERLLAKRQESQAKETLKSLDFTPLIEHLKTSLSHVLDLTSSHPSELDTSWQIEQYFSHLKQKVTLQKLLARVEKLQKDPNKSIHIIFAYHMPEIFDYAAQYEPTTGAGVSEVYNALAKIFCNLTGDKFYG